MTPSLIRTQYLATSFNVQSKVQREDFNVTIDLGGGLKLACNRREDFERLKVLTEKAIEIFGGEECLK